MSDLRCLRCGYDLRGLEFRDDQERCPECGRLTDLNILAIDLVARQQRHRRVEREVALAIAAVLGLMPMSAVGHDWAAATIWSRLCGLVSPAGVTLTLAFVPFVYALTIPILAERSGRGRLAFMVFALGLLLIASPILSLPALAVGTLVYHTATTR